MPLLELQDLGFQDYPKGWRPLGHAHRGRRGGELRVEGVAGVVASDARFRDQLSRRKGGRATLGLLGCGPDVVTSKRIQALIVGYGDERAVFLHRECFTETGEHDGRLAHDLLQ